MMCVTLGHAGYSAAQEGSLCKLCMWQHSNSQLWPCSCTLDPAAEVYVYTYLQTLISFMHCDISTGSQYVYM